MEQRVSLVTLGVADLERARRLYEALGWTTNAAPDDDIVFFQAGGMIVALWDRGKLAEDTVVSDNGGWGGITLAHCVGSDAEVDAILSAAATAGATITRSGAPTSWGGYSGVLVDPDGHAGRSPTIPAGCSATTGLSASRRNKASLPARCP